MMRLYSLSLCSGEKTSKGVGILDQEKSCQDDGLVHCAVWGKEDAEHTRKTSVSFRRLSCESGLA